MLASIDDTGDDDLRVVTLGMVKVVPENTGLASTSGMLAGVPGLLEPLERGAFLFCFRDDGISYWSCKIQKNMSLKGGQMLEI
jgi:hypothetical protein